MSPPARAIRAVGRLGPLSILIAFAAGFAALAVEFAVVRVTGPWFGQGTYVWANTVAVVLLALALGYGVGGRWADRGAGTGTVTWLLAAATAWLSAAALAGPALAEWLAPASLGADRPHPLSLWGSLAGTTILTGPALLCLGAVSPILVARASEGTAAGRASAAISAAGTLGGLLGCAAAPTLLVPWFGSRGVFLAAGVALGAPALLLGWRRARARPATREAPASDASAALPGTGGSLVAWAALAAFACGVVVTLVEFGTMRRLAPRHGSDNGTWALVIGTILVGSAAGTLLAHARVRRIWVLPTAVVWLVVGGLCPPLSGDGPTSAWRAVLDATPFALAVLPLAAVPPLLVTSLVRRRRVGSVVAVVFGASTLGNVLGCYVAPLLLLPALGTRATFLAAALLAAAGVAAAALAGVAPRRTGPDEPPEPAAPEPARGSGPPPATTSARLSTRFAGVLALAVPALATLGVRGPLRTDAGQVDEVETAYQTIRVVDRTEFGARGARAPLYFETGSFRGRYFGFDEDSTSYQSVRLLDDERTVLTAGRYYEHLALGAWFTGQPWTRATASAPRVLVVGYCGGTLHRVLATVAPAGLEPDVLGVEIDPAVVDLARTRFGPLPGRLDLRAGLDGRAVVGALGPDERFDLIVVDAYQRTQYVPFQLATVEFFRLCAAHLAPTGAIGINVNSPVGAAGRLVRCLAETLADATGFDAFLVPNAIYPGNVAVWGGRGAQAPRVASSVDGRLELAAFSLDRLLVRHVRGTGGAFVLTDDRAPTEALADEDLLALEAPR